MDMKTVDRIIDALAPFGLPEPDLEGNGAEWVTNLPGAVAVESEGEINFTLGGDYGIFDTSMEEIAEDILALAAVLLKARNIEIGNRFAANPELQAAVERARNEDVSKLRTWVRRTPRTCKTCGHTEEMSDAERAALETQKEE